MIRKTRSITMILVFATLMFNFLAIGMTYQSISDEYVTEIAADEDIPWIL